MRFNVFERRLFNYLNQNFQLHRSFGGKVKFFDSLRIQRNGKVGTTFVLKICTMFIDIPYKRILFNMFYPAKIFQKIFLRIQG